MNVDFQKVGYPKPGSSAQTILGRKLESNYASCVRIVDPVSMDTVHIEEFENNDTVFSMHISKTVGLPGQVYLFLGIGNEANL